mgnify:CR=1 FL=1
MAQETRRTSGDGVFVPRYRAAANGLTYRRKPTAVTAGAVVLFPDGAALIRPTYRTTL